MNEDQVKDFIDKAISNGLKSGLSEFSKHFTEQLKPYNDRLAQFEEVLTQPAPQEVSQDGSSALLERIANMENAEKARVKELQAMRLDAKVQDSISRFQPLHQETIKELLSNRYGKAIEQNGDWYLPNGKSIAEDVQEFFSSDVGSHFIPSKPKAGLGSGGEQLAGKANSKAATVDDMLLDTFF